MLKLTVVNNTKPASSWNNMKAALVSFICRPALPFLLQLPENFSQSFFHIPFVAFRYPPDTHWSRISLQKKNDNRTITETRYSQCMKCINTSGKSPEPGWFHARQISTPPGISVGAAFIVWAIKLFLLFCIEKTRINDLNLTISIVNCLNI